MQDPIDAYRETTTCPFCQTKFSEVVKLIPDCGKCICGTCYDDLIERSDETKEYKCHACGEHHVLPENGLPDCKQLVSLLLHPIEKPLSEQAKRLELLVESVRDELVKLRAFEPRDHVEQHCVQLEHEVSHAADSAVKHIKEIEADLHKQIQAYRQRCLAALEAPLPNMNPQADEQQAAFTNSIGVELDTLTQEISDFSTKWTDYFKQLNVLASDSELEAATSQVDVFQTRMRALDKDMKNRALCEKVLQFNPKTSFHSQRDHMGELVEIPTQVDHKAYMGEVLYS